MASGMTVPTANQSTSRSYVEYVTLWSVLRILPRILLGENMIWCERSNESIWRSGRVVECGGLEIR